MAAGQGTRMRSSLAKVLAPGLRSPDARLGRSRRRARPAPDGSSASRARGRAWPRRCRTGVEHAEQVDGRGHRRGGAGGARRRSTPTRTVLVLSGDHPLIQADLIAGAHRRARRGRRRGHAADHRGARPEPATAGSSAPADGSVERIVETKHTERRAGRGAGDPRDQPRHATPSTAGDLFDALDTVGRGERRALPHRRLPGAARAGPAHRRPRHRRRARAPSA